MSHVDKCELMRQMEAVALRLESHDETGGLAKVIRRWIAYVGGLMEPGPYLELTDTIQKALKEARKEGGTNGSKTIKTQ